MDSKEAAYIGITGTKTKQLVLDFLSANTKKQYSVQDLHNTLCIPESTLSINMAGLDRAGILLSERKGKYKYYSMNAKYAPLFRSVFRSLTEMASKMEVKG